MDQTMPLVLPFADTEGVGLNCELTVSLEVVGLFAKHPVYKREGLQTIARSPDIDLAIPIGRRSPEATEEYRLLLRIRRIAGSIPPELFAVDDVDSSSLSGLDQRIISATGARNQNYTARGHISIVIVQLNLIERRKSISHRCPIRNHGRHPVRQIQLDDGIAIVHRVRVVRRRSSECAVACSGENSSERFSGGYIGCKSRSPHPDAGSRRVWSRAPSSRLLERRSVVCKNPSVPRPIVHV